MERDLTISENETSKANNDGVAPLSEISDLRMVPHLSTSFSPNRILSDVDDSLPYHQLGGPGLERLCYSLISVRGGVPRYFGNPGQKQCGIDLIVTDGGDCTVYQCKNVSSFTQQNMGKALSVFEEKWLGHEQLPRPTKFVLCCPLPLRERQLNEDWTVLEREFFDRTGVRIGLWDKEYLDSQLKKLPDVVADLFSDQAAERFCDLVDWNEDLFRPVRLGSGDLRINRYLRKKADGQIYLNASLTESFRQKLEHHGGLLILGAPGTGKTITGLALAESFRGGFYRLFYVNMLREVSEDALVKGIRRRLARPTIFLIDDCHGKYDEILEGAHDRLQDILARQPGKALLVYVARTFPTPEGIPRADYSRFVEGFKEANATLEFRPTPKLFANITALAKSDFQELSEERLNRIFSITGQDLFLLDQLLDTIKSPDEIDLLEPEHLFERTLLRYFGQPTVYRPGFMMLTALAQFEIAPAVSNFPYDLQREDPNAAAQLLIEVGRPLSYFFLHSSAAELVFRALAWNDGLDNHAEVAALKLIEFFADLPVNDRQFPTDLSSILRNRLKLRSNEGEEYLLKSRFLSDDRIHSLVTTAFERISLNTVVPLLNMLKSTDSAMFARYHALVQRKIDDGTVLKTMMAGAASEFLQLIRNEYPAWYSSLREQFANQGLSQLVRTKGIQYLLRRLVKFASERDFILDSAFDSVNDDDFDGLVQRTITLGRSISNFHWDLKELKNRHLPLFEKMERRIGARRYLRLIVDAGTILELFMLIQSSSPSISGELVELLDDATLDCLINKTISSERSITALEYTLRELKKVDTDLLEAFEQKIGAQRFLRLVASAGTFYELFMAIRYSSPIMATELIETLDDKTVNDLIDKTIATGRSIATLHLALRELKETEPSILEKLEHKIGARRYLHLITSSGTIFELLMVIRYSSHSMTMELIEALNNEMLEVLIKKTVATGRSTGTLSFALRELKRSDSGLLEKLEQKFNAVLHLRLIANSGTLRELFKVIENSSRSMAAELAEALDDKTVNDLIDRTITTGCSIGTIPFALRELKLSDLDTLDKLERKIGIQRWWKLILTNGKINNLAPLLKRMDDSFRQEMVRASLKLTKSDWDSLLLRGDFRHLAVFVRVGEDYSPKLFNPVLVKRLGPTFEKLIDMANLRTLSLGAYNLSESKDSRLKDCLEVFLERRLIETEIASLHFDTFEDAVGFISMLWRRVPSKRGELIQSLFSILPKEDNLYRDKSFLRAACGPLFILASSRSSQESDWRILDLFNHRNVAPLCECGEPLEILLYLWNLYSLWFKCERVVKGEMSVPFSAFLDSNIRRNVNHTLIKRLRHRTRELEQEHLVSLCGLLYASGIADFSKEDKAAWLHSLLSFEDLLAKAESMESFIVASFFLIGLGWIFDRDIPKPTFVNVISKANSYEARTDALNNLHQLLSIRIR